jgi:hypothetical protein
MPYRFAGALVSIGLLLGIVPALAHHATQAEYDKDKPKTITGMMSKIQWINPHVRWYIDVKDESGNVKTWRISGAGPGAFRANGVTGRGVFKVGSEYTATIALARDGSDAGYIMTWVMPDGTKMDFWHQYGDK